MMKIVGLPSSNFSGIMYFTDLYNIKQGRLPVANE